MCPAQAVDKDTAVRALGAKPPGSHDRGGIGLSSPSQHTLQGSKANYNMSQLMFTRQIGWRQG